MTRSSIPRRIAAAAIAAGALLAVAGCGSSASSTASASASSTTPTTSSASTPSASATGGYGAYGGSSSSTSATAQAAGAATVAARHTKLGTILVAGNGHTLYAFGPDGRNRDRCAAISGCLHVWPALTAGRSPVAGPGVRRALLSTIALTGGHRQVTYAGHPLYTYIADSAPGETSYVGINQFGGPWPAVSPTGSLIR